MTAFGATRTGQYQSYLSLMFKLDWPNHLILSEAPHTANSTTGLVYRVI